MTADEFASAVDRWSIPKTEELVDDCIGELGVLLKNTPGE